MIDVLIVDDEPAILEMVQSYLEGEGDIFAKTAGSAFEAIKLMRYWSYDAIISDYLMPGGTGLDLLRALRRRGNGIPFLLFTAKERMEIEDEALGSSDCAFIEKGANLKDMLPKLKGAVRQMVGRRRIEDAALGTSKDVDDLIDTYCHDEEGIGLEDLEGPIPAWMKGRGPIEDEVAEYRASPRPPMPLMVTLPARAIRAGGMTVLRDQHTTVADKSRLAGNGSGARLDGGLKLPHHDHGLREVDDIDQIEDELRYERIR